MHSTLNNYFIRSKEWVKYLHAFAVQIIKFSANRGKPGRIVKELECVYTFPAVLRTRPGLGQNVITVCRGYATVCDGTFPV